ncbi:MAG TPA: hypothetical protein VGV38_03665 [Pyrinomonadaceae bacterium]|nr:hypothetical protein [Pyrinomonadaceae bacterium]
MKTKGMKPFESAEEVEAVARGFESCATSPDAFGHREHLALALCYLTQGDAGRALGRVRDGIYKFLRHHGEDPAGVYNETVTIFWLRRVQSFLDTHRGARTLDERANALLAACGDSKVIYVYYSRGRLSSEEARVGWVEPDLKPLDF